MQFRTQLGIVALVATGWGAGTLADVTPALPDASRTDRLTLGALESLVARSPDDVVAVRALLARYLELEMPRLVLETAGRTPRTVQRDGRVSLSVSRAHERLGSLQSAEACVQGALTRCLQVSGELAVAAGCDVRTQTELAVESTALDRMVQWHVDPVREPERAAQAHEIATHPIRMTVGP